MQQLIITFILVASLCLIDGSRFVHAGDPSINDSDGTCRAVVRQFLSAAERGDHDQIVGLASPELNEIQFNGFADALDPRWRLYSPTLLALRQSSIGESDLLFAEVIIQEGLPAQARFYSMHWVRRAGRWQFMDFPFTGSGVIYEHAFKRESMEEKVKRYEKAAEPGATDNPDDAQRLREDY